MRRAALLLALAALAALPAAAPAPDPIFFATPGRSGSQFAAALLNGCENPEFSGGASHEAVALGWAALDAARLHGWEATRELRAAVVLPSLQRWLARGLRADVSRRFALGQWDVVLPALPAARVVVLRRAPDAVVASLLERLARPRAWALYGRRMHVSASADAALGAARYVLEVEARTQALQRAHPGAVVLETTLEELRADPAGVVGRLGCRLSATPTTFFDKFYRAPADADREGWLRVARFALTRVYMDAAVLPPFPGWPPRPPAPAAQPVAVEPPRRIDAPGGAASILFAGCDPRRVVALFVGRQPGTGMPELFLRQCERGPPVLDLLGPVPAPAPDENLELVLSVNVSSPPLRFRVQGGLGVQMWLADGAIAKRLELPDLRAAGDYRVSVGLHEFVRRVDDERWRPALEDVHYVPPAGVLELPEAVVVVSGWFRLSS